MALKLYDEEDIKVIANALREKLETDEHYTVSQMANKVRSLDTISATEKAKLVPENILKGVTIMGVKGNCNNYNLANDTITPDQVLAGVTFHDKDGNLQTGTIQKKNPSGYNEITNLDQMVSQNGYFENSFNVRIAPTEAAKIIPENIISGVTILGVTGTAEYIDVHTGSTTPSSSLGKNGDIYLKV